jgi:hypothetical protein
MRLLRRSSGSARRSRGSMRSGKSWLGSSANWRRPSVCWRAIAQARRERSRPSRPLHRPRQLLQRSGNAAAGLLRPRNQVTVVAPRQPSAIRCLPWQPAERSTKSLPLVRGLARTMSARPSPGTSGQAASKSATGSYTQAKRQRRRNTQRSDSAVNGRSRSSVTADRKVELTAAVSLAATTGGLFFLADEGQDEGAARSLSALAAHSTLEGDTCQDPTRAGTPTAPRAEALRATAWRTIPQTRLGEIRTRPAATASLRDTKSGHTCR